MFSTYKRREKDVYLISDVEIKYIHLYSDFLKYLYVLFVIFLMRAHSVGNKEAFQVVHIHIFGHDTP